MAKKLAQTQAEPPSRTELGKRLRAIRQRIVASGAKLLSPEEVGAEVARRRGGRDTLR